MLKTVYATREEIPEGYADLYTERNGQWELTGVQGVKTQADIDRLNNALIKERADHKAAKELYRPFEGLDIEALQNQAHELEDVKAQLEAVKSDGSIDEAKLEPVIAARVAQRVAPVEREKTSLQRQLDAAKLAITAKDGEVLGLKTTITSGNVERAIRDAAVRAKVLPPAIIDAVMHGKQAFEVTEDGRIITKDVPGVTPGLSVDEWLKDQVEKSPHWWPTSIGGGSQGGPKGGPGGGYAGANNPWSKAGWNMTKQGALVKTLGAVKAAEVAALAGCKIGDTKPAEAA